jgi:hypothetical protein
MKHLILILALLFCATSCLPGVSFAQSAPEAATVLAITEYRLSLDNEKVYGLFDLGDRPSLRFPFPNPNGGKIRFRLHAQHFQSPVNRSFSVVISYEDVTGREFEKTNALPFNLDKQNLSPEWFSGLENIAGLYGGEIIEVNVPPGTVTINMIGDNGGASASPNELLGYITHIETF